MKRTSGGFTLIELLVVVAIIALLISILLPSLQTAREQAKRVVCGSNLRSIAQAMVNYSVQNRDVVPAHQGPEPDYVFIKGSTSIMAPGNQWHLGELLLPQMNTAGPPRNGPGQTFLDQDLFDTKAVGRVFYCPSTGNGVNSDPNFPTWGNPNTVGSFMDYAQFWNYIGIASIRVGRQLYATQPQGVFQVLDDDVNVIPGNPTNPSDPSALVSLPYSASRDDHLKMPNSSVEVPLFGEYMTSFNRQAATIRSDFLAGRLKPEGGNHPWTGHTSGGPTPNGGNFGYVDGHVEWRTSAKLRPRLLIDRVFVGGSVRPTYWW